MNVLDDSLSADRAADGAFTNAMVDRFIALARYCVRTTAPTAILFTCSAFGPAIEAARAAVTVPEFKPNEAMLFEALDAAAGTRPHRAARDVRGVAPVARDELQEIARRRGQSIELPRATSPTRWTRSNATTTSARRAGCGRRRCVERFERVRRAAARAVLDGARPHRGDTAPLPVPVLASPDSAVLALRRSMR